jgi:hypothetical protein
MAYQRLLDRLVEPSRGVRVVSLPDGSVDTLCRVYDGGRARITSREAFGRRVAAGDLRSVRLEEYDRAPGGQSVNAARQAHALGGEVTLFGHLDDPLLQFPFETYSMGDPAAVTVLSFDRTCCSPGSRRPSGGGRSRGSTRARRRSGHGSSGPTRSVSPTGSRSAT